MLTKLGWNIGQNQESAIKIVSGHHKVFIIDGNDLLPEGELPTGERIPQAARGGRGAR